jgi:hypothetical protein
MQDPDPGHVNDAAQSGAPRRRRWLVTVAGGVILLLGIAGFIGHIVRPEESYWSETYGPWGLVLGLGLDAVFIALGGYLLARGREERSPGVSVLSRVNTFATRTGERSRWTEYSATKRRVAASLLTVEAAIVSFGISWLLLRSEEAGVAPWFIGGSWFIWFTAFVWGLTLNPTKATKWALLLGPPLILVVGVGGSLLSLALTS